MNEWKPILLGCALFALSACENDWVSLNANEYCVSQYGEVKTSSVYGQCYKDDVVRMSCDKKSIAKFIIECATAANPKSDEEGEDLVKQCQQTAFSVFCELPTPQRKQD